ncbi:MAG: dTDP-4-dehydrorhamnose reductase [Planctomycetota bacterium]|nr:MAG: dTDP-4-dehydrorhamnose reductase [Planctomycetota bacterium]REK25810.1 MAG: dTDP-4-dehydrorhamnose reductase [Planctomycetota bacterium]REK49481.1 MAG: dTDP-4-dehydrorhamnose reductase [Planctomycetota bacterium]
MQRRSPEFVTDARRTVAVLGARGQLGRELCRQLGSQAIPIDRSTLDVEDRSQVHDVLRAIRPIAVVNAAGFTAVDLAEVEVERCRNTNVGGAINVADACQQLGLTLVQLSTDYVFSGSSTRSTPFREDDLTCPLNVYAESKAAAESAARCCERHFIVRTCGLYTIPRWADKSVNFVKTMLRLASEERAIRVVDDQCCSPTYVVDLASAISFLIRTYEFGTYHIVNRGSVSWYDFASRVFELARLSVDLQRISTIEFGAAATRPAYSALDGAKYGRLGGPRMRHWSDALAACICADTAD